MIPFQKVNLFALIMIIEVRKSLLLPTTSLLNEQIQPVQVYIINKQQVFANKHCANFVYRNH